MVLLAFVTCVAVCLVMGYGPALGAGLFAGALTSTPGLAVAVELTGDPAAASAYGLTYVSGVIGVILYVKLLPALLRVDLKTEEAEMLARAAAAHPPLMRYHIRVNNPNIFGRKVRDLDLRAVALKKSKADCGACGGRVDVISPWTIFRWLLGRQSWTGLVLVLKGPVARPLRGVACFGNCTPTQDGRRFLPISILPTQR
jgi:hypothetical protein